MRMLGNAQALALALRADAAMLRHTWRIIAHASETLVLLASSRKG